MEIGTTTLAPALGGAGDPAAITAAADVAIADAVRCACPLPFGRLAAERRWGSIPPTPSTLPAPLSNCCGMKTGRGSLDADAPTVPSSRCRS